jgi:hypothetical protein
MVALMKKVAFELNTPMVKQWAFELEQLDLIRQSMESRKGQSKVYVTTGQGFSFCPERALKFDGKVFKTMLDGAVYETMKFYLSEETQDGTMIYCHVWNQDCVDVAFYKNATLTTFMFAGSSNKVCVKLYYIGVLYRILVERGLEIKKLVHIVIKEKDWFDLQVDVDDEGWETSTAVKELALEVYRSPPLKSSRKLTFERLVHQQKKEVLLNTYDLGAIGRSCKATP